MITSRTRATCRAPTIPSTDPSIVKERLTIGEKARVGRRISFRQRRTGGRAVWRYNRPPFHTIIAGYSEFQKGGDPAAGSPTATLLRLRPSH